MEQTNSDMVLLDMAATYVLKPNYEADTAYLALAEYLHADGWEVGFRMNASWQMVEFQDGRIGLKNEGYALTDEIENWWCADKKLGDCWYTWTFKTHYSSVGGYMVEGKLFREKDRHRLTSEWDSYSNHMDDAAKAKMVFEHLTQIANKDNVFGSDLSYTSTSETMEANHDALKERSKDAVEAMISGEGYPKAVESLLDTAASITDPKYAIAVAKKQTDAARMKAAEQAVKNQKTRNTPGTPVLHVKTPKA